LVLSCASSQPPQTLTVHIAPGFTGTIHVSTCVASAPAADVSTDIDGAGQTSACPARNASVAIAVVRGHQQYTIGPEKVTVLRTGDGLATSIQASIRP
jgi:hypothetical protein